MPQLTPQQRKKLEKLVTLEKVTRGGDIALLIELDKLKEKIETIQPVAGERGEQGEKGERGDRGTDGKDGKDGKDGRNGADGKDGKDGVDGKDGEMGMVDEATIAYLEDKIKQAEEKITNIRQGRAGWGAHPLQIQDGATTVEKVARVINFGDNLTATRSADGVVTVSAASGGDHPKTLTFNADGSLDSCTDSTGSETIVYTLGIPSSVIGTGVYVNKTLTYTDTLDAVTL